MSVAALFRPFQLDGLTLPNRVVMAPMGRHFVDDGVPSLAYVDYFRRRVEGGTGLVITEVVAVDQAAAQRDPTYAVIRGEAALSVWRRVVDDVHRAGGRIFPQLYHCGMSRFPEQFGGSWDHPKTIGPSGLWMDSSGIASEGIRQVAPATRSDIDDVIEAFAASAATAQRLGFDGIEIHGAHGYLIDQFFWEKTNRRTDAYGGDLAGRGRLAAEVIAECRRRVGPGFPIFFRLSQWKQQDYTARLVTTPLELERFLEPLALAGTDVFHCSQREIWTPEFSGSALNLAGWTKKITGLPTISVGSITLSSGDTMPASLRWAIEALERDEFDMLAVGRALIANPDWTNKVRAQDWPGLSPYSAEMLANLN